MLPDLPEVPASADVDQPQSTVTLGLPDLGRPELANDVTVSSTPMFLPDLHPASIVASAASDSPLPSDDTPLQIIRTYSVTAETAIESNVVDAAYQLDASYGDARGANRNMSTGPTRPSEERTETPDAALRLALTDSEGEVDNCQIPPEVESEVESPTVMTNEITQEAEDTCDVTDTISTQVQDESHTIELADPPQVVEESSSSRAAQLGEDTTAPEVDSIRTSCDSHKSIFEMRRDSMTSPESPDPEPATVTPVAHQSTSSNAQTTGTTVASNPSFVLESPLSPSNSCSSSSADDENDVDESEACNHPQVIDQSEPRTQEQDNWTEEVRSSLGLPQDASKVTNLNREHFSDQTSST